MCYIVWYVNKSDERDGREIIYKGDDRKYEYSRMGIIFTVKHREWGWIEQSDRYINIFICIREDIIVIEYKSDKNDKSIEVYVEV